MDVIDIIDSYYKESGALRSILLTHSKKVAEKALQITASHPELDIDGDFVYAASMLHDIGIICCDAPSIECHGSEPYIRHGICGARMIREGGWRGVLPDGWVERCARVCERHTGAGLTVAEIKEQNLPLPARDFLPETIEEKLICYADKFYSKTHLEREKSLEHVLRTMRKFGADSEKRFSQLHELFR